MLRNQPPRSTQPGHPFMGRCNEYQPKSGDALRLGSTDKEWFVCGWQVKLCDPVVTHGPRLSCTIPVLRDSGDCSDMSAILMNEDYYYYFLPTVTSFPGA